VDERAPVALVADDGRAGTEDVAVAEPSAVEDPMTGSMHRVTPKTGSHIATYAVIATTGERDTGHGVLRTTNNQIGPERRYLRLSVRSQERISLERAFVPDHYVAIVAL